MATRAHLVRRILKELGSYQSGQDLPPEDYRVVDEELPYELSTMASDDIFVVADIDAIDDDAVVELAKYLAGQFAATFGLAGEELQAVQASQGAAEQSLRYKRARKPTYARQRTEYF